MTDPPTRAEAANDELESERELVLGALYRATVAIETTSSHRPQDQARVAGYRRVARRLRSGDLQLVPREALEER